MIVSESSHIQWGRTRIDFGVRRSSRRKTVSVAVDPTHGVVLTAPEDVTVARLHRVVKDKASWIVERLRRHGELETCASEREFVNGESFLYLGRNYRLQIKARVKLQATKLEQGRLVVTVDRDEYWAASELGKREYVESELTQWYQHHAQRRLPERMETWAVALGIDTPRLLIRSQQKRWGSCDQHGMIRMNWRIIQAPMKLVDYVVAHELVHLRHKDHTKAFWARLGAVMPDYESRKDMLRRMGPRLGW